MQTPNPGESKKDFYARTADFWTEKVGLAGRGMETDQGVREGAGGDFSLG